ncbi:MAG TPA: YetF domain-containing protein [Solirubrobacteraceae bacterium]
MDIVLRAFVVFFVLLVVMRAVGRRELNTMEPFDVILLVVIGDLVQQGVTQSDYSLTGAVMVIATITLLTIGTSYLSFRFRRLRPVLEGEPLVLLQDGRPIERNLRRERITLEELRSAARQQQIGSLERVRLAILETDGRISFIPAE